MLSKLGIKHGTDKGTIHSYLDLYELYTKQLRGAPISLLEIGIDKGASIRMWREWFPNAQVEGIDNNYANVGSDGTLYCLEQTDAKQIRTLFDDNYYDIIIDDGSHEPEHQILSFHYLWRCLKPNGLYFIEDIRNEESTKYWDIPGATIYRNHKNGREDDVLVVIKKIA